MDFFYAACLLGIHHLTLWQRLHEFLYPKDEYTVSEKVKEIASEIETLTGYTRADYTESAQDTENQE